jgi:hypothetical protein
MWAYTPGVDVFCITDAPELPDGVEAIPLEYDWPGWWSKLELFRPDICGDFLYMDLDTVVTGDIAEFWTLDQSALLSDLYRPAMAQSGVMYLTEADRARVWRDLGKAGVNATMRRYRGDGEFLRDAMPDALRLQDVFPGRIVSYKGAKVAARGVPKGATLCCFHGRPRPRDVKWRV